MLRFLGLMVMIVLVGAVALFEQKAPQAFAQYEGWKTYYNQELKFAIDYPSYSESVRPNTNITELTDEVYFDLYYMGVAIKAYKDLTIGPEEFAVAMQQTVLEQNPDSQLVQSVETVLYNGELGYGFTVYTPSDGFYINIIYFYSPNTEYDQYKLQFVGTNPVGGPISQSTGEFFNTIRFFD